MAEATGERAGQGRSLRSSPRTGKPSAWRRWAVDTLCRQERDILSDAVNTEFHSRHATQAVSVGTLASLRGPPVAHGHAWRAGCGETRTSGSERGMKKPAPATGQGASSLLYRKTPPSSHSTVPPRAPPAPVRCGARSQGLTRGRGLAPVSDPSDQTSPLWRYEKIGVRRVSRHGGLRVPRPLRDT